MTMSGELIIGTAFLDAARQGWKEITGKELPTRFAVGDEFWDELQQNANQQQYLNTRLGLAYRAGSCGFHNLLDLTGEKIGLRTAQYRLHPVQQRIELGLGLLAQICQQSSFKHLSITSSSGYRIYFGESLNEVQRGYLIGFFQEFLEWASQGRVYPLVEQDIKGFCFAVEPINL